MCRKHEGAIDRMHPAMLQVVLARAKCLYTDAGGHASRDESQIIVAAESAAKRMVVGDHPVLWWQGSCGPADTTVAGGFVHQDQAL